jgi:hypothetical protein
MRPSLLGCDVRHARGTRQFAPAGVGRSATQYLMNDSHRQSPVSVSLHGLDSFCKKRIKEALVQFEFVNERITAETQRSPRLRRERRLGPSDPTPETQWSTGDLARFSNSRAIRVAAALKSRRTAAQARES